MIARFFAIEYIPSNVSGTLGSGASFGKPEAEVERPKVLAWERLACDMTLVCVQGRKLPVDAESLGGWFQLFFLGGNVELAVPGLKYPIVAVSEAMDSMEPGAFSQGVLFGRMAAMVARYTSCRTTQFRLPAML